MDAGNRLALFVDHATDDAFVATHAQLDYLRRLARLYAIQDRNIALGSYSNDRRIPAALAAATADDRHETAGPCAAAIANRCPAAD